MSATKRRPKDEEHARVAERIGALLQALGMTQDQFADASSGLLRRTEVSAAKNGQTLCSTERWHRGISKAAEVDVETVSSFLRGEVTIDELMHRRSRPSVAASTLIYPMVAEAASRLGYSDYEAEAATAMVKGLVGPSSITEEKAVELLEMVRYERSRVARFASTPAIDPGTGGGFSGKVPQRPKPTTTDDEDDEPPTKINPRRRR